MPEVRKLEEDLEILWMCILDILADPGMRYVAPKFMSWMLSGEQKEFCAEIT